MGTNSLLKKILGGIILMVNVKVFSDFNCPFCFIATGIVEQLKKDGVDFSVEWIPYESYPEIPLEGKDLYNNYSKEQVDSMYEMLGRHAKPYSIEFGNAHIKYNSHRALLAGEYAKTVNKYDDFSKEVFKAAFTDVKNIGHKDTIDEIAEKVRLNIVEMNKSIDEGKYDDKLKRAKELVDKHNIKEVPTFVVNDEHNVINIRNYKRIKKAIVEAK